MSNLIEALSGTGKRERVHNAQMVLKLPLAAKQLVNAVAQEDNVSDSAIVRIALAEYFERRGYTA